MTIWDELGIDATNDIRLIKKAYAKKVKQSKPDEKPKEFQVLHAAYKQALEVAHQMSMQVENELPAPESVGVSASWTEQDVQDDTNSISLSPSSDEADYNDEYLQQERQEQEMQQAREQEYQAELERIMAKVETVLTGVDAYKLESWQFLLQSEYMLDQYFADELSYALLKRIAQYYNNKEFQKQCDFRMDETILQYLNSLFSWDSYGYNYHEFIYNEYGLRLFSKLNDSEFKLAGQEQDVTAGLRGAKSFRPVNKNNNRPYKYYYLGGGVKRATAMIIDYLLAAPIIVLVNLIIEVIFNFKLSQISNFNSISTLTVFIIGSWLFECSRLQATPGKLLTGLRVTTLKYDKISHAHGFFRILIFGVTCIGFYVTILINSFLNGRFIHDRLSRTYVVDLWRTNKEFRKKKK